MADTNAGMLVLPPHYVQLAAALGLNTQAITDPLATRIDFERLIEMNRVEPLQPPPLPPPSAAGSIFPGSRSGLVGAAAVESLAAAAQMQGFVAPASPAFGNCNTNHSNSVIVIKDAASHLTPPASVTTASAAAAALTPSPVPNIPTAGVAPLSPASTVSNGRSMDNERFNTLNAMCNSASNCKPPQHTVASNSLSKEVLRRDDPSLTGLTLQDNMASGYLARTEPDDIHLQQQQQHGVSLIASTAANCSLSSVTASSLSTSSSSSCSSSSSSSSGKLGPGIDTGTVNYRNVDMIPHNLARTGPSVLAMPQIDESMWRPW